MDDMDTQKNTNGIKAVLHIAVHLFLQTVSTQDVTLNYSQIYKINCLKLARNDRQRLFANRCSYLYAALVTDSIVASFDGFQYDRVMDARGKRSSGTRRSRVLL